MKLYYTSTTLLYAVWDRDNLTFTQTTVDPLNTLEIDELLNTALCKDLAFYIGIDRNKVNSLGQKKYSIVNNQLNVTDNWIEEKITEAL